MRASSKNLILHVYPWMNRCPYKLKQKRLMSIEVAHPLGCIVAIIGGGVKREVVNCELKYVTHSPGDQPGLQLARPFTPSAMNCIAREASKTPSSLLNMLLIVCPTNLANVFENKKQINVIK
jgi:hypothetical protein